MAHSTEFGIKRDTAPGAAPPTIHEQQRFWDWHWQHWQDRRAINEWALHRGERVLNMLRGLALDRPRILVDRLGTAAWEPWPREHIEHYLDMKDLKRLLRPHFRVRQATTVLPLGDAGILRLINSHKLNKTLSRLIPQRSLDALKERAG